MFDFLSFFDSLTSFEFTEDEHEKTVGSGSMTFWIRSCLDRYARRSLKKLKIKTFNPDEIYQVVGRFRTFNALEELDIDLEALIDEGAYGIGTLPEKLPASIKKLTLRHPTYEGEAHLRFATDVLRKQALPNVELLSFKPYSEAEALELPLRLEAACEEHAISVTVD